MIVMCAWSMKRTFPAVPIFTTHLHYHPYCPYSDVVVVVVVIRRARFHF